MKVSLTVLLIALSTNAYADCNDTCNEEELCKNSCGEITVAQFGNFNPLRPPPPPRPPDWLPVPPPPPPPPPPQIFREPPSPLRPQGGSPFSFPQVNAPVVPRIPPENIMKWGKRILESSCADGFRIVNNLIKGHNGYFTGAYTDVLDQATYILVHSGLFKSDEFVNVTIRWGRLLWADGHAPDRNYVVIHEKYRDRKRLPEATSQLAHEMVHVRQYRYLGSDRFKCEYSRRWVRNLENESNSLEREAYNFQRHEANPRIAAFIGQGGVDQTIKPAPIEPGNLYVCVTPGVTCWYRSPSLLSSGSPCSCRVQHPVNSQKRFSFSGVTR